MGMIKRMLRRTSRKLLAKIVPPHHQQELVLNPPLQPHDMGSLAEGKLMRKLARKYRRSSKDTAVAEALLLAVKNHLPPVQFHHVHGPNVKLTKSKCVARRTQSFCQALVFSNRVILPNERIYIKVLEIAKGWSGTIRFGFTAVDPATLARRMPKHACPDMTNAGHTWARALADEVVRRNSVIHFSYNKNGLIHYGINNQDCGVFHANIGTNQNLWFIVDIYGLTAAVELIDPRVNSASSELDISQLDDSQLASMNRSTMFKSTSAMDELFGRYGANESRLRKKHSRKQAARHAAMLQKSWYENPFRTPLLNFDSPPHQQYASGVQQLPNLNSINLPSAQQNIYSPLPNTAIPLRTAHDVHDYYQIYTKANPNISRQQQAPNPRLIGNVSTADGSALASSTIASNAPTCSTALDSSSLDAVELDLSQRLDSAHLGDRQPRNRSSLMHSTPKTSRSLAGGAQYAPVAAARKRTIQQQLQTSTSQTNLKTRGADASDKVAGNRLKASKSQASTSLSASKLAGASNGGVGNEKSRTRHSIKSQRSSTSLDRDKNNNSPPSKDCPICFERPINCVLYQCGHMCTCYECGVKQWKTQSRTCPICRTIIKDVIKTYMS